jgi:hypothetical protein
MLLQEAGKVPFSWFCVRPLQEVGGARTRTQGLPLEVHRRSSLANGRLLGSEFSNSEPHLTHSEQLQRLLVHCNVEQAYAR